MSPKQVVGFTCVFNSEVDQLIGKFIIAISKDGPVSPKLRREKTAKKLPKPAGISDYSADFRAETLFRTITLKGNFRAEIKKFICVDFCLCGFFLLT